MQFINLQINPSIDDDLDELYGAWNNCDGCSLCHNRTEIVHWRGYIPAPIMFIGEAPGDVEDAWGLPFVGPAGRLLNEIIDTASEEVLPEIPAFRRPPFCFINLVACQPDKDGNGKQLPPTTKQIQACHDRLVYLLEICRPRVIVCVGTLAQSRSRLFREGDLLDGMADVEIVRCIHPSAVLQAPKEQYGRMYRQAVAQVSEALRFLHAD